MNSPSLVKSNLNNVLRMKASVLINLSFILNT
ncbi:MAG: hypothetical protein UU53_C0023G0004 [Candidatus Curtissbacteria bacterium GW2011_GWC2_41_21]|nr:MAG: hypothetical protein UU53_C0023G0004 [Candidatus Curtissbacteria bacterium GW2011_GWC2_41_21]